MGSQGHSSPRDILDALLEVAREVGSPLALASLLRGIESATQRIINCERVTVFVHDPERDELFSRLATGGTEIRVPVSRGIAGRTFSEHRLLNIPDVSKERDFYPEVDKNTGFVTRSLLSLPLIGFDSSTVGVLQMVNKREGVFNEADEQMARALAALTGVALQRQLLLDAYVENQRREEELRRARQIQRSLLPDAVPNIPGYDIAGWSRAANETGGDFYDYLPLPDGRTCVVVADVSGHGFDSALIACETRALLRGIAAHTGDLATLVTRANQMLYSDLRHELFVTLFAVALSESSNRLEYVSAGCVPFVYRSETASTGHGAATTPPLAILERLPAPVTAEITTRPGDVLALVTDGFYEWENTHGEQFGLDRVASALRESRQSTAADAIQAMHTAVSRFAAGPSNDDLTAVIIKRT